MKKFLLLFSILLITNSLISCKKEEGSKLSKTELLTAHRWYGDEQITYTNNVQTNSHTLDDSFVFKKNHEYYHYDNNGDLDDQGQWELEEGNPDIITFIIDGGSFSTNFQDLALLQNKSVKYRFDFKIKKLTKDRFSYYTEVVHNNDTIRFVSNYKK